MKIGCYFAIVDYGWRYIIPSIEYRHKYWYLWEISISWWKWSVVIDFCRKDWNKQAEKDLELTWEDIATIERLCDDFVKHNQTPMSDEEFYKEIVKRFKDLKK